MTRALRTLAELVTEIKNARAACVLIEDCTPTGDLATSQPVKEARARVDAALEAWARAR